MEVVLENAKLLRGIFLLSEGQKGLVCLQVNPLKHSDADGMLQEALYVYSKLTERFGGVPNVVFKLPATKSGLEAADAESIPEIAKSLEFPSRLRLYLRKVQVVNQLLASSCSADPLIPLPHSLK